MVRFSLKYDDMGYHLIIRNIDSTITAHYSETYEGLAQYSDISRDSIIYEGEAHWQPVVVGQSERYKNLAETWFRAGIKAQKLFKEQAMAHGLMIEDLSQDAASFKAYTSNAEVLIKRGDFLLRNVRNIEVETKCFTFYKGHFYIEYSDIKGHQNMQTYSGSPVVLAIYERKDDVPIENSLFMLSIDTILEENNKKVRYDEEKKCLVIPCSLGKPGFSLIDEVRKNIETQVEE